MSVRIRKGKRSKLVQRGRRDKKKKAWAGGGGNGPNRTQQVGKERIENSLKNESLCITRSEEQIIFTFAFTKQELNERIRAWTLM